MKKIITILLSLILLISCLVSVGCQNTNQNENDDGGETLATSETMVLMNGFEDFSAHIQCIKLINGFGQVNPNKDAKYVKSGKQSIQLRPNGYDYVPARPLICVPTYSVQYDYAFADFSDVKKVLVSAYNAQETPIEMGISLAYAETSLSGLRDEQRKGTSEYFTLKPGWNELEYDVIPAYMESVAVNNKFIKFNIKEIHGICFDFDYVGAMSIEETPIVYLDDIYLVKHEKDATDEEKYGEVLPLKADAEKGVWEVCDFEDPMQRNFMASTGTYFCSPVLSVVSGVEKGISPKSGMNMLKWVQKRGVATSGGATTFIGGEPMSRAIKAVGDDIITNPQNYTFKIDVYNASEVNAKFSYCVFRSADDKAAQLILGYGLTVEPNTWKTFEINFGDVESKVEKDGSYVQNPGYFSWVTNDFRTESDNADRVVYIDNIRIERIATTA